MNNLENIHSEFLCGQSVEVSAESTWCVQCLKQNKKVYQSLNMSFMKRCLFRRFFGGSFKDFLTMQTIQDVPGVNINILGGLSKQKSVYVQVHFSPSGILIFSLGTPCTALG